jgi:ABC-type transport system involved in cytochrome c biogenesis permease subunit
MSNLATIAWIMLIHSLVVQVVFLFRKSEKPDRISVWFAVLSIILLTIFIINRSITISFIALTGTYESLLFYADVICSIAVIYRFQKRIPYYKLITFVAIFLAFVLLAIASSPLTTKEALSPVPALRSSWLLLHVSFAFIGEAFFVVSFAASIAFLLSKNAKQQLDYDRITYVSIAVGYPIFTAGAIIFGAIWAQKAWGRWWGWDPKETWALITWLVYTFYLHIRLIAKKTGKIASLTSVVGFLCTVFTFFGVNFLLPGLHSYR